MGVQTLYLFEYNANIIKEANAIFAQALNPPNPNMNI